MSVYPWMKRHKRYLSFRYLFPEIAAGGITIRRALLRVKWFFTHSVDEIVDDLWAMVTWPFTVLAQLGRWSGLVIYEFLKDLDTGIRFVLRWLGQVPVWTGAALAGVMGVILTILLFLLPALQTRPVPAAIGSDRAVLPLMSDPPPAEPDDSTSEPQESEFDPFAPPDVAPPKELEPVFPTNDELSFSDPLEPDIHTFVSRLTMPIGWDSGRRIHVVSTSPSLPHRDGWMGGGAFARNDGWKPPNPNRSDEADEFSPYVSRIGPRQLQRTSEWISPADTVAALNAASGSRRPSIIVEKQAPQSSPLGRPFHYVIVISNRGEETLESVRVREQISAIERVTDVHPPANVVGNALVWDIADLHPGEQRRLMVEMHPNQPFTLAQNTTVQVTSGITAVSEVSEPEPEPELIEPEPEPLRAILRDFDPETTSSEPPKQAIDEPVRELFPWDDPPSAEVVPPQEEPPLYADEIPEVSPPPQSEPPIDRSTVPADAPPDRPPADALALTMDSPPSVASGEQLPTIFELHNRGDVDVQDVVLKVRLSDELDHQHGRALILRVDRLEAGETYRTRLTTHAIATGTAKITSRLLADGSAVEDAASAVEIAPAAEPRRDGVIRQPRRCPPPPCGCGPWF